MTQINLDNEITRPRTQGGMSIGELSNRIRAKEISPVELINACLERIDKLNPRLNAFITVLGEQACDQAKQAEAEIKAGQWRGPLHGVPVGIKDFYDTAGIKTTAAFEKFKDRVPKNDCAARRRARPGRRSGRARTTARCRDTALAARGLGRFR